VGSAAPNVGMVAIQVLNLMMRILLLLCAGTLWAETPPVPGAWETRDLKVICGQRTSVRRNVSAALKKKIYRRDGRVPVKGQCCEVDHLTPICLGGANSLTNLWAQSWDDAHRKDVLEVKLNHLVCSGKLSIITAQHEIATDWEAAYRKYVK
jgi:hypothetical protein